MIAFGCMVGEPEPYRRYAEPGIRLAAEEDSVIYPFAAVGTIGRSYNLLLEAAGRQPALEALVILHPHTEITDPALCQKIRTALGDPDVAVVGFAGATGVRSIAWWDGSVSSADAVHRYTELGGGELPMYAWRSTDPSGTEVETIDGSLMVLSPWAVENLRFDEGLVFGHGFEIDFCIQARSAGKKVMTADLHVIQHRPLEIVGQLEIWVEAHMAMARKHNGRLTPSSSGDADWEQRARRAEAEREATRALVYSRRLAFDAHLQALQRRIDEADKTVSWRLTRPLREANVWRRRLRERRSDQVKEPDS